MSRRTPAFRFMKWMNVHTDTSYSKVAIRRLIICKTPWFCLFVHWIREPDGQRDPHDHPWNFWTFLLRGGYIEEYDSTPGSFKLLSSWPFKPKRVWRRGSFHKLPITAAHRIIQVSPGTMSLVLTGRRQKDWGFWTKNGFVNRQDYVSVPGTSPNPPNPMDI